MMKNYFLYFMLGLLLSSFSNNTLQQEPKIYKIIKANGDTLLCNDYKLKFYGTNYIKYIEFTNKSNNETTRIKPPEGFVLIYPSGSTVLFDTSGYDSGNIEISGKDYILTRRVFDNGLPHYFIINKNYGRVHELTRTKKCVDELKKYFGDCPEFIKEIDLVAKEFDRAKFPFAKFDILIQRYKC